MLFVAKSNSGKSFTVMDLPEISRFDPQALSLCLRPKQVIRIDRKSDTALEYKYYRVCI